MQSKRPKYALNQSPLYRASNRSKLAFLLGATNAQLRRLSKQHDVLYSEFMVPKKNGTLRGVENPRIELKKLQARIARLLGRISPPDYLFCPVKKRCYVSNAAQHRNQRIVHCLDIRRYYPSTPSRRVYWFFHKIMKCESHIAGVLTNLATYKGHLPTGSPLSPILAYYAFYDLWEDIARQCRQNGYILTVYIDDVTISGDKIDPVMLWDIKRTIHRAGLRYHKEKHYVDRPAEITGVIVDGAQLKTPHRQLKKLHLVRQKLALSKEKDIAEELQSKLRGITGQIAQVERIQNRLSTIAR